MHLRPPSLRPLRPSRSSLSLKDDDYVDDEDGEDHDYDGISAKSLIFSKPDFGIVVDALGRNLHLLTKFHLDQIQIFRYHGQFEVKRVNIICTTIKACF